MKLSKSVKSISYLKAHASELVREVAENRTTLVITQNGEAKAVVQDVESYEETMESLALLKMLAQSSESRKQGRFKPVKEAFADARKRIEEAS